MANLNFIIQAEVAEKWYKNVLRICEACSKLPNSKMKVIGDQVIIEKNAE